MIHGSVRKVAFLVGATALACGVGDGAEESAARMQMALSSSGLVVEYHHGEDGSPTNNEVKPYFRIRNTGALAVPLSELTLRYFYTLEGSTSESSACYYAQVGCGNITRQSIAMSPALSGADHYFRLGFTSGAGTLQPGLNSGDIKVAFHTATWEAYNENDDYSYIPGQTTWGEAPHVALYRGGVLVWGSEPGGGGGSGGTGGAGTGGAPATGGVATGGVTTGGSAGSGGSVPTEKLQLQIRLPKGARLSTVALGAAESLAIADGVHVDSAVAGGRADVASLGTGELNFGIAASVLGDVWSVGPVKLRDGVVIDGDVTTGADFDHDNVWTVTGDVTESAVLTPAKSYSWQIELPVGSQSYMVLAPSFQPLVPGSYGTIAVQPGAKLGLSSGFYYLKELVAESDSTVQLDASSGPVVVYVRDKLAHRGRVVGAGAADYFLGFIGEQTVEIDAPFSATVVASNAAVRLSPVDGTGHEGAFYARDINVDAHNPMRFVPFGHWDSVIPEGTGCPPCVEPDSQCLGATCVERIGQCVPYPLDGAPCDDGDPSTHDEICVFGSCTPSDDSVPSNDDTPSHEQGLRADPDYRDTCDSFEEHVPDYVAEVAYGHAFTEVLVIPVIFHVLENAAVPHVDDATLLAALATLNDNFANIHTSNIRPEFLSVAAATRIQFALAQRGPSCMATPGIERVHTDTTEFEADDCKYAFTSEGGVDAWPNTKYLNIWVAPLDYMTAGRATFVPSQALPEGWYPTYQGPEWCFKYGDGVALDPERAFDAGDATLTHEVGHWLTLVHIENPADGIPGRCDGTSPETCASRGDMICDTPADSSPYNSCTPTDNTCVDTPTDYPDQHENFMRTTGGITQCETMFTFGQVDRMYAALTYNEADWQDHPGRSVLAGSDALIPPPDPPVPGDPWIRDGLDDLGVEPNDATEVVWQSDDIWMRNQQDGVQYQQHENPSYVAGASPYVYVRVRNRSCAGTEATTLTVRWAKASASLGWPAPWDASQTAPAACTAAPKMGGVVGTVAVPALEPGASTIVELQWQNLPNPTQYSCFQGEETHFCLLAHIGDVSMVPQELVTLVRSSNNIAWKNLNIAEDADETSSVTVGATPDGSVAALTFTDPALPGSPGSVFEWGDISVDLGPGLFARWVDGGMLGDGIESISTTTVTLGDSGGAFYNLELEDEDLFTVKVYWTPKAPASAPRRGGLDIYHLDVTEWAQWGTYFPKAFGGVRLVKKTTAPLP